MRTFRLLLCLSLGLLLALPARASEPMAALLGMVKWIYDGDTLEVEGAGTVRLIGIDVPEKEASHRDRYLADQGISPARQRRASLAAREFNIAQVKGRQVRLVLDEPPRDKYGRLLAYVYLPDGRLLNRLLVEQGMAVVYRRFSFNMKEDFLAAEAKARRNGAGLWAQ